MLLDRILSHLAPHECLSCFAEGKLLCIDCERYLIPAPSACYHCGKPTIAGRTCISCLPYSNLSAVHVATAYKAIAKDLVGNLKFKGTQAAATEIADQLAPHIRHLTASDVIIIPVPTATSRVRQRGYDQADLIARAVARTTGHLYISALRRSGQIRQLGSSREQRISQLDGAYRVVRPTVLRDAHVILVDDVLTTGSTLEAAAKVVKAAGATRVSGLVFARA